jgi:hypothetical protein
MKVLSIKIPHKLNYKHLYDEYYKLTSPYEVQIHTDCGVYVASMGIGWVTDFRSGSALIDWFIPRKGNAEFNAAILFHDFSYSGWVPKDEADELLRQCSILSDEICETKAKIMFEMVQRFGKSSYFNLDEEMYKPYNLNRELECFQLLDKL